MLEKSPSVILAGWAFFCIFYCRNDFRHVLTHRDLDIHIVSARLGAHDLADAAGRWFGADEWPALGLPAPIRKLLQQAA